LKEVTLDRFLQLTITGLSTGMIYALIALGFVIIYKSSDVINFAQGDLLLIGAFIAFAFIAQYGLPWSIGVMLTLLTAVLIGVLIERIVLRPLIGEPIISMIMVTIGLSSVLRALVNAVWGPVPRRFPAFIPSSDVSLGGAVVSADRLIAIGVAGLFLVLFTLFFRFTREGIAMRAIADDQQAALSMGISVKRVFAIAWAIAAVSAAVGGIILANIVGVGANISHIGLAVFPVVILGGLDSVPGAVIGGAIIGLLQAYTGGYIGHGLNLIVPYILLILVLMVRPYGLFGKEIIERV
jgi:branched-chain amino acid transport system permease protein